MRSSTLLAPQKSKAIDLESFVPLAQIQPGSISSTPTICYPAKERRSNT